MSNALQLRTEAMDDWQVIRQQAEVLVKTGFLPKSITTPEQAMAVILTGRELGIGAMAALQTINVIQGKPTASPQLMLALINRTNQVEDIQIAATKDGATCTIKRAGRSPYTARFGSAEATAMGLSGKDNYKKQPATMYKWRAVADACRFTFSDVILGLYTPDEMGAQVDVETGEVVEVAPEPIAEPEPVRNVKLAGAQPQPTTPTDILRDHCHKLGYDDAQLFRWVKRQFGIDERVTTLAEALNCLGLSEISQAIDIFSEHMKEKLGGE